MITPLDGKIIKDIEDLSNTTNKIKLKHTHAHVQAKQSIKRQLSIHFFFQVPTDYSQISYPGPIKETH